MVKKEFVGPRYEVMEIDDTLQYKRNIGNKVYLFTCIKTNRTFVAVVSILRPVTTSHRVHFISHWW